MFAVPGWSVPAAALKTQKPTKTDLATAQSITKRKRSSENTLGESVTSDNLADLWEKHIDGKKSVKRPEIETKTRVSKREKKRRKHGQDAGTTKDATEGSKERLPERGGIEKPPMPAKTAIEKEGNTLKRANFGKDSAPARISGGGALQSSKAPLSPSTELTPLQSSMRQKLISSRFRSLNETLYTTSSTSSYELFSQNPGFFTEYHEGFRRQVTSWPENPVDGFVRWIRERGNVGAWGSRLSTQKSQSNNYKIEKDKQRHSQNMHPNSNGVEPLPRNFRTGICTIIDLGCGEAKLSEILSSSPSPTPSTKSLSLRIQSFDLATASQLVTAADIRSLPLPESSVDIAIFCLALMGTNWIEFVEEAYRVLRWKGECWISEVSSRFGRVKPRQVEHSVGKRMKEKDGRNGTGGPIKRNATDVGNGAEDLGMAEEATVVQRPITDVSAFVSVLQRRGFVLQGEAELGNKMFVRMRFTKALAPSRGKCVQSGAGLHKGNKRFITREKDEAISIAEEASVLKPCVYKTR